MLKNNEKQTKDQQFKNSSTQLTENEMLCVYGGDSTGSTSPPDDGESG